MERSCRSQFSAVVLAAYENWRNLFAQLITMAVFASRIVKLISGTILVPGLVQPISLTKFMSEMVLSRSPAVYFIRHRPHAKLENRLRVINVFMTDMMKLIALSATVRTY